MTPPEQRPGEIEAAGEKDVTTDDLSEVLTHSHRRFVTAYLQTRSHPTAMADIATELTKWESAEEKANIPKDEILSRYISLYHVHIPKMTEVGLLEWNQERNTVALGEMSHEVLEECPLPSFGEIR